ncbi:hypothetical protein [uncultured Desulfosarcina sp.]|uniref:hypothetical protein n=1 Tax=uncultured Desulfosarcina sp. TaxID=218289 RepID=UPI0029C8AD78|nr:hypothetical protein [uncultured Desulfosarcina sp.]
MKPYLRVLTKSIGGAAILAFAACIFCGTGFSQTRQEHVHHNAHMVMPFDISKAVHIFKMTASGGIQRVVAKDPSENDQISLIRRHLKQEAENFQRGDFSDPAKLHGAGMPGLRELQGGAHRISIFYTDVPAGGAIRFETSDIHLITAVHRWFGAQLSEHGADAVSE